MKRSARRATTRLVHRDRYVPYLLGRISKGIASAASVLYRERLGVGINDSRILVVLARRPRITGKELSEDTSLNKSVVSRSLRVLRSKGLVRVVPTDSRLEVELTPAGWEMHDRVSGVALQREALMLKGFSPEEKTTLIGFLHRMLKNVPLANAYDPLRGERGVRRKSTRGR
ncbi:MAG TPA: MarR family winged helix-turn-helix transcriptional regulator [Steroidobacteraceae bacterium]|nr:MarR family winged helix-turn-helix transcriptional regulator [Steroidobacteraceae bacterium]